MDSAAEVAQHTTTTSSSPNAGNNEEEKISTNAGEKDDDVNMSSTEVAPNDNTDDQTEKEGPGSEKSKVTAEKLPDGDADPSSKDDANKVRVEGNNNTIGYYKDRKKNKKFSSAPMSKRALRKWKRMHGKGIEETGPLTTNPDPGYGADVLSETEYYFEDDLRKVYPYFHTFTSYVKGRWLGRTVLDVFTKEFHVATKENLIHDIETGLLRVNDKIIKPEYKLKFNDLLSHKIHRHENPVVGTKLEIIQDDEHVIVVNKPSSIPCHPCGRYRYNSIVFILGKEYGYSNLRNIYRLDRLTSGVLICAKTSEKTRELEDQILNKQVTKEYVCRVFGKFPDENVEVDQPLQCINHKISLWQVRASGKPSQTSFKRLSYNGKTSVVQCFPVTGRTHQIRVHLQHLGHPILNDPLYAGDVWGPDSAQGKIFQCSIDEEKIGEAVMKNHNIGLWVKGPHPLFPSRLQQVKEEAAAKKEKEEAAAVAAAVAAAAAAAAKTEGADSTNLVIGSPEEGADSTNLVIGSQEEGETNPAKAGDGPDEGEEPLLKRLKMSDEKEAKLAESRRNFDIQKWIPDGNCSNCQTEYIDPQPKDLVMYLHALSYKGLDWEYRTALPDWAQPDWQEEW